MSQGLGKNTDWSKEKIAQKEKELLSFCEKLPDEKEKINQKAEEIKAELKEQNKSLTVKEEKDLPHAASAKTYNIENILTFNRKDFLKYDHVTVWTPTDINNDLKLDLIEKPQQFNQITNPQGSKENDKTYVVNLSSGESAKVTVEGLKEGRQEANIQEARNNIYSKEAVEKIAKGEKEFSIKASETEERLAKQQPPKMKFLLRKKDCRRTKSRLNISS